MDDKDDISEGSIISYISYLSYTFRLILRRLIVDVDNADVVSFAGLKTNAAFFQLRTVTVHHPL